MRCGRTNTSKSHNVRVPLSLASNCYRKRCRRDCTMRGVAFEHIGDAHCHAHLDAHGIDAIRTLKAKYVAIMGVCSTDWSQVLEAATRAPDKVIPCFGIHPWKAHLHASTSCSGTVADTADGGLGADDASLRETALVTGWLRALEQHLQNNPRAVVGEIGLDRAARIPGTTCLTDYGHQWELFDLQMELAARYHRPVSLHCVRAYGHLQDKLRGQDEGWCPERIMLHSYSGSPEMVKSLVAIGGASPTAVGKRLYFSFSTAINMKTPAKMLARIGAVPDDKLLIESDQVSASAVDDGLEAIVQAIADAKGWTVDEAIDRTWRNFQAFYHGHLPEE